MPEPHYDEFHYNTSLYIKRSEILIQKLAIETDLIMTELHYKLVLVMAAKDSRMNLLCSLFHIS